MSIITNQEIAALERSAATVLAALETMQGKVTDTPTQLQLAQAAMLASTLSAKCTGIARSLLLAQASDVS